MRNRTATLIAGFLAVACAGCSGPKSVQFYKTHPAIRALKTDRCTSLGRRDQACINAIQASFEVLGVPAKNGRAIVPAAAAAHTP